MGKYKFVTEPAEAPVERVLISVKECDTGVQVFLNDEALLLIDNTGTLRRYGMSVDALRFICRDGHGCIRDTTYQ